MKERKLALVVLTSLVVLAASAAARAGEGTVNKPGWTGSVTEEQFKAMHELKTGPAPELHGSMIELAGGKAYLSLPPGAKPPFPAVVVIQEWWGLNDHIKHWSDRLAAEGYAALAVDLYDGKVATTPDSAMAYVKAVNQDRANEILMAAFKFLAADPRVQATRRGSIGWCFGGGQSLALALAAPELNACVMYYGRPELDPKALQAIKAPLLGIFGNLDQSIPPATVNEFDAALGKAGVKHTILRYDAPHAFANPSNPKYDEKSAGAAWMEVQKFLAANLKQSGK
jgi:carboxymethylenebutenolidase